MSNKQAFARIPRGKTSGKFQSGPKAGVTRIDAKWLSDLEKARMNPDLGTVMTKSSTELVVTFNAQGSSGFNLQNKVGDIVADQADIIRVQTLNTSITKERKEAQKSEVSETLKYVLAAYVRKCLEINFNIVTIPMGFVEVYRGINASMNALTKNVNSLEAFEVNVNSPQELVKKMMIEFGKRIRTAVGDFLIHRLTCLEGDIPRKVNRFLFERHVPMYIYGKLTSPSGLGINQAGFEIRTLLFPNDPSKGFYLTYRECLNDEFTGDLGGLLDGADLMIEIAKREELIRALINVDNDRNIADFDEENSLASKMASVPFWVPPFPGIVERSTIFNFLAKNGTRGVNWQSGSVLSPQDNLKFVGTIAKRIAYGLVTRPMIKDAILGRMFPGFVYDKANEEARDIFVQLRTWSLTNNPDYNWFKVATCKALYRVDNNVKNCFADVVALTSSHAIPTEFARMAAAANAEFFPRPKGRLISDPELFSEIKNLALDMRGKREDALQIIGTRYKGKLGNRSRKEKGKGQNRVGLTERSALTAKAKHCVDLMKARGYVTLSERMTAWFRQFLTESVQAAVADLFAARLDAFLSTPIELNREDRLAFMEAGELGDEDDDATTQLEEEMDELEIDDNPDDS